MKTNLKLMAIVCIALASFTAQAQQDLTLPAGTKLMGGTAEFRGILPDAGNNRFEIGLSPIVGIFVMKNLAVGPGLNLAYSNTADVDEKSFKFGISPLVRYYIGDGNMKMFGQATAGYNWTETTIEGVSSDNNFGNAGFGIGMAMFPAPPVGLDVSLNYLVNPRFNDGVDAIMLRVAIFAYKRPMK